jgi:hypothetical protein
VTLAAPGSRERAVQIGIIANTMLRNGRWRWVPPVAHDLGGVVDLDHEARVPVLLSLAVDELDQLEAP